MTVGILVPSYDGYSDLWPIAATLFQRYWPDRPWPMYWMTTGLPAPDIATTLILPAITRESWGLNIARAIESIPQGFILLWIEEIFLLSSVPTGLLLEAADILTHHPDVGIIQLTHYYYWPKPEDATIGNYADWPTEPFTFGFTANMPALFRRDILLHLLRTTPRSDLFELTSYKVMARDFPTVRSLVSCQPMFRFCDNAVLAEANGAWRECAVAHLREEGIAVDFSRRGISPGQCRFPDGTPV